MPFTTLDLVRATSTGWAEQRGLSLREVNLLHWVAMWGKRNEPGYAFVWFPTKGMTAWQEALGMPRRGFYRALEGLSDKGCLVPLKGSRVDPRFHHQKGYGIPVSVAQESVTGVTTEVTSVSLSGDTSVTSTYPLTRDFPNIPDTTRDSYPVPYGSGVASDPTRKASEMNSFVDEWSTPEDDSPDDFAIAKDERLKPIRTKTPTSRVSDHFYDRWLQARIQRPTLATPWSAKQAFLANLKRLLAEQDEATVLGMVDSFFDLLGSGKVRLRSDELWKDFWNSRGTLLRSTQQRAETSEVNVNKQLTKMRKL